jgi:thioredoxin
MISCNGSKADAGNADSAAATGADTTVTEATTAATDPAEVIELEADDQIVPQDVPVIIDFNATWCGPCQKFAPVFHKLAEEYASKATFASADVDKCTDLAAQYNVSSIPAVIIIYPASAGKEPVSNVGYMDEAQFKAFLDANL